MGGAVGTDNTIRVAHLQVDMWMIVGRTCADAYELFLTDIDFPDPDIIFVSDDCWPWFSRGFFCGGLVFRASRKFGRLESKAGCSPNHHRNS